MGTEEKNRKTKLDAVRERSVLALEEERTEERLWDCLLVFSGFPFVTARGLEFTYEIKRNRDGSLGNEIFFSRKEKSVTRATVNRAFHRALELQEPDEHGACGTVSGPKKLGVFGASYLYPVFCEIGVIR